MPPFSIINLCTANIRLDMTYTRLLAHLKGSLFASVDVSTTVDSYLKRQASYTMLNDYQSFPASQHFGPICKQAIIPSASIRKSIAEGKV